MLWFTFLYSINFIGFYFRIACVHCAVRAESFNANKVNLSYQSVTFVK